MATPVEEDLTSSDDDALDNYSPQKRSNNPFEETRKEQGTGYDELARQDDVLLGEKCIIVFTLPDGSKRQHEFRMGHSVEWLKQAIEDKHGINYHKQTLYFNGKLMIDPLSLSDIKGLLPAPHENDVEVKE
eukprot:TRINITY_DN680_c0_g2_i1.p1 TRINITY_DN680_c0_g2~~TRINITY_DN680_c0_g2_i1.p1  ORF type:complete len:131 (-),score=25.23 TRINITY_DN680_c0_g2_i1:226-618(-)